MKEQDLERGKELIDKIANMEKFIYGIDKRTVGNLGHTGFAKIIKDGIGWTILSKCKIDYFSIEVPKEIVHEIARIGKRELKKMKQELEDI